MTEEDENPDILLTFSESRVLGCLLEKERTTPEHYPLTLNALQSACNQRSSRDPVTDLEEDVIDRALEGLRDKGLAVKVHLSGSRVPKYKQTVDRQISLSEAQISLIAVLMLRGIQTAGELKQRTERLYPFSSGGAVEHALGELIDFPTGPLVRELPAGAGRRVKTFVHLLCGEPEEAMPAATGGGATAPVASETILLEEEASWRKKLETEVADLRLEVAQLREELEKFRQEFQ